MNIIIVGCGKVGSTIAQQLNEEENNITIIDQNAAIVNDFANRLDIMGVVGNGATHIKQQEAGIKNADLLIAVTGSDELNLLCCLIAKKAGNCQTIARVRSPEYSLEAPYLKEELGLAMVINPEAAAAAEIDRVLRFPSAIKIDTFAKGRVELLKFKLPEGSPVVGCAVKDIVSKFHCDILVCTVERGSEAFIARGDFVFEEKDIISIIASPRNANDFFRKIKYKINSVKDAMIVGGGAITYYLCERLQRAGISAKIIEKDRKRCEEICSLWPDTIVINGDAVDKEILIEEGIKNVGAFVALTNLDEENILLSLFAQTVNNGKIVTKINRLEFDDVIQRLELDSTIYPKNITSDMILRYVRAMRKTIGSNVETLYSVIKGQVEAAEFSIKENSAITDKPLSELKFKDDILIAAILRGRTVIIPRGSDTIQVGDAVVIVSRPAVCRDIKDILR